MNDLPAGDRAVPSNGQAVLLCLFRLQGLFRSTEVVSYSAFVPCLLQGLVSGGYFGDTIQWTEIRYQDFLSGSPHTEA